jgi:Flp pilus assembly protein TadB
MGPGTRRFTMSRLLYVAGAFFIALWVLGFVFKFIVVPLVHLALVIGLFFVAFNYFQNRRHKRPF